jgi:hypothetical protein
MECKGGYWVNGALCDDGNGVCELTPPRRDGCDVSTGCAHCR